MKGIFLASRMRATIWPTRPKPAMTTWPSFSGMASKARATTAFGASISSISSSSGVAAIDSVTATDRRSATGCSSTPEAAPVVNSTKANSPPWAMASASRRDGPGLQPGAAAEQVQHGALDRQQADDDGQHQVGAVDRSGAD